MSQAAENRIKNTSRAYSNYGELSVLLHPDLTTLLSPMNCFKALSILPFKLPTKFIKFLELMVVFEETDYASKNYFQLLTMKSKKNFLPKKHHLHFFLNLPPIKFNKNFLRVFSFSLFICFRAGIEKIRKLEKLEQEGEKISCVKKYFYIYLVKLFISVTYINLPTTVIYLCSSLQNPISFLEFSFILADIGIISFFLFKIRFVVEEVKNSNVEKLDSFMKLTLVNTTMAYQNGKFLAESLHGLLNFSIISKILVIFCFQNYPKLCAIFLFVLSAMTLIMIISFLNYKSYYRATWILAFTLIIESVIFLLIGLVPFFDSLRNNNFYNSTLIVLCILWLLSSLFLSASLLFEKKRLKGIKLNLLLKKNFISI